MAKNIIVCCDGTGNQYGDANSNVVKLYSVLDLNPAKQVAYYHPGVGTMGAKTALTTIGKKWTLWVGKGFGYGISDNIADAYQFLMHVYAPGDLIYIFGFSRGAYTARALCALLHMFGILSLGNEGLIPYAIRYYKGGEGYKYGDGFKKTFSQSCLPHFLGLWDTVSSVGWFFDPPWPYVNKLRGVCHIRHAMSIDERRAFFRDNPVDVIPGSDVKQVWFSGVHSDVGGSYPEDESGLSKISLQWMLHEAESLGLLLDSAKITDKLGGVDRNEPPNAAALIHNSLKWYWSWAEFFPKFFFDRVLKRRRVRFNLFRARSIPDGAVIHQSVFMRKALLPDYRPRNLPQNCVVEKEPAPPYVSSAPINLNVNDEITFRVESRAKWTATNLQLKQSEQYEFTASGTWVDSTIPAYADGYVRPKSPLLAIFFWFLRPLRRIAKANWFALVCMLEHDKSTVFHFTNAAQGKKENQRVMTVTAPRNGCLNCFANDLPFMYGNNKKAIFLNVKRIA